MGTVCFINGHCMGIVWALYGHLRNTTQNKHYTIHRWRIIRLALVRNYFGSMCHTLVRGPPSRIIFVCNVFLHIPASPALMQENNAKGVLAKVFVIYAGSSSVLPSEPHRRRPSKIHCLVCWTCGEADAGVKRKVCLIRLPRTL